MISAALSERLDTLIDELIMDGGVEAASLASILLAAKDSVNGGYHVMLSRRVWAANNELIAEYPDLEEFPKTFTPAVRLISRTG